MIHRRGGSEGIPFGVTITAGFGTVGGAVPDAAAVTVAPSWHLWTPLDLGATLLSFVQDDTLSAGAVTTWTDQSGNGNSPTQATGSKKPTASTSGGSNNRGYVQTDGTDDFLRITFTLVQPCHWFMVMQAVTAPATGDTFLDGASGNTMRFMADDATHVEILPGDSVATTPTNWHFYEGQSNGGSGQLSIDGGAYAGTTVAGDPGGYILGIFGDQASAPADARYSFFAICDSILSADEVSNMRAYLRNRYAL